MLTGKMVIIGITGSIAAYKTANLVRMLKKQHCDIQVIMTENAVNFINPITFESITGNKCLIDTFDRNFKYSVEHVALAKRADAIIIAPASANIIGKIANGIADDMLSTTIMACTCPKLISPAMNHNMLHNPIVEDNILELKKYGYEIIPSEKGMLANGDIGDGRMPDEAVLFEYILRSIAFKKDMKNKKILVTAGATCEAIDPVRFITNHSSGKMGFSIARAAMLRGADVKLITAAHSAKLPLLIDTTEVISAEEMFNAVKAISKEYDIIVMAAAVADYTPVLKSENKIKKSNGVISIEFKRTRDILKYLGENKQDKQVLCGFSMETENLLENSRRKLFDKNCDMICANSINISGSGFSVDTNIITIITADEEYSLELMSKEKAAHMILNKIIKS